MVVTAGGDDARRGPARIDGDGEEEAQQEVPVAERAPLLLQELRAPQPPRLQANRHNRSELHFFGGDIRLATDWQRELQPAGQKESSWMDGGLTSGVELGALPQPTIPPRTARKSFGT